MTRPTCQLCGGDGVVGYNATSHPAWETDVPCPLCSPTHGSVDLDPQPEAEDILCHALMPSLWERPVSAWTTLHLLVHDTARALVEDLEREADGRELLGALLEAVA